MHGISIHQYQYIIDLVTWSFLKTSWLVASVPPLITVITLFMSISLTNPNPQKEKIGKTKNLRGKDIRGRMVDLEGMAQDHLAQDKLIHNNYNFRTLKI